MMTKKYNNLKRDKYGVIREYNSLHDSEMISILNNKVHKRVEILCISESHKYEYKITLINPIDVRCNEWSKQNILLETIIFDNSTLGFDEDIMKRICFASECNYEKPEPRFYELVKKFKNNEIIVFQIIPSNGAYCIMLVEDVLIEEKLKPHWE